MRTYLAALTLAALCGCGGSDAAQCGSPSYGWCALVPGVEEDGHDAELADLADRYDRGYVAFHAYATGLNTEVTVPVEETEARALIETFLDDPTATDFTEATGAEVPDVIAAWAKSTGLYSGAGLAADAYRYGVLRDTNADPAAVEAARQQLLFALDGLHAATRITGVEGVLARSIARTDLPGAGQSVDPVPLFDEEGVALPYEKNNGTWRVDESGEYPNLVWEDSCSRDMMVGWAMGYGAVWEVIGGDDTIPEDVSERFRADARALGAVYPVVRESGFDLEIPDADGRTTFHGYLNEDNIDRVYSPGIRNGFHSIMALGIVAAFAYAGGDPELWRYLHEDLVEARDLPGIAATNMLVVNLGPGSNFSNYNMAFTGALLALRYLDHEGARANVELAVADQLYAVPGSTRQPLEQGQTFFDFIYAGGLAGMRAEKRLTAEPDPDAMARGLTTLKQFPTPPFWDVLRENCDADEIASTSCTADDGRHLDVLGEVGWKGLLICEQPIPMAIRPPSNYYWRSNPYAPNGGGSGSQLLPGVDFRVAYWLGRWTRR